MTRKRNYYTSSNYNDHTTFGGYVYNYDFDGHISISDMANRIISDKKFDEKCRKLGEDNKHKKNNKKGTK